MAPTKFLRAKFSTPFKSSNPKVILFLLLILGASFFGFVDDRFRGWDDTNQFQIEAKAWHMGATPPTEEILKNPVSDAGPRYEPPLTPYVWSALFSEGAYRVNLKRIKFFQALLVLFSFVGLGFLIWKKKIGRFFIFAFPILFFFNELFRDVISTPISEPLSVALLIAGYLWPPLAGVAAALEAVTRPAVLLLFGPLLWRYRKDRSIIAGGGMATILICLKFKKLVIPSTFGGLGIELGKTRDIIVNFVKDWAKLFFDHLLPYQNKFFLALWSAIIFIFLLRVIFKNRKETSLWFFSTAYFTTILLPWAQGVRYFVPLLLVFVLHLQCKWKPSKISTAVVLVILFHLMQRQAESVFEFRKFFIPETETRSLVLAKEYVHNLDPKGPIMMHKFRYCINFFDRQCYGLELDKQKLLSTLKEKRIKFIVLPHVYWQIEEPPFEKLLLEVAEGNNFNIETHTQHFENVAIINIGELYK